MSIQATSLKAYLNEIAPTLSPRQMQVLEVFEKNPDKDFTNEEIAAELDWRINHVTGRTQELRGEGKRGSKTAILRWTGERRCGQTGRPAKAMCLVYKGVPLSKQMHPPAPSVYQMPSKSKPGGRHVIRESGSKLVCPCRGFYFRRTCSHIKTLAQKPTDPKEAMQPLFK